MTELAKPHADSEDAGYIYMFWLTPTSKKAPPPVDAARSLLVPPPPSSARSRRPSDIVSTFADPSGKGDGKTMLLKIGRAANVQRRMNQWQRQCGYDIEILRYYPYVAAVHDGPGTSRTPRMTPHCRRVERLIHIELAGMGLRADTSTCGACGREHREWFEVKATREGIRRVDDVIRRWVDWDETSLD
ncbi:DNA-binding protein [Metarhizium rileyi]|nr:DNA-binding protein [Metarhizium rileyi RCEF 4871]